MVWTLVLGGRVQSWQGSFGKVVRAKEAREEVGMYLGLWQDIFDICARLVAVCSAGQLQIDGYTSSIPDAPYLPCTLRKPLRYGTSRVGDCHWTGQVCEPSSLTFGSGVLYMYQNVVREDIEIKTTLIGGRGGAKK